MTSKTFSVQGMTCGHCVQAVSRELAKIPGVRGVHVDLAGGRVTVSGEGIEDIAVVAAVTTAGYAVTV